MKRSLRCATWVIVVLLGTWLPARAGERLKISELVGRSRATVLADVDLGRMGSGASVKVVRVVRADGVGVVIADPAWIGGCTGSIERFRHWLQRFPKWPAAKLWKTALERRTYRVVLFLAPGPSAGTFTAVCETEAMEMAHTSLHPGFAEYVKSVESEVARARSPR
jgi:hypothetical protein